MVGVWDGELGERVGWASDCGECELAVDALGVGVLCELR